VRARLTGP
jgi:hypothetical protein